MNKLQQVKDQLELTFSRYLQLHDHEQDAALDMTVVMLRKMQKAQGGKRKALIELGEDENSDAEKARSRVVRKSNAASPQSPVKPVRTTKKNELRKQ